MNYLKFEVPGIPASKGSLNIGARGQLYPADKKLKGWQNITARMARRAATDEPSIKPINLSITYYMPQTKPDDHGEFIKRPDLDKLARAIMDGLTGIIYHDDAQVYHLEAWKLYAPPDSQPGAVIEVSEALTEKCFDLGLLEAAQCA